MKNLFLLMVAFLLFCSTSPPDFHVRANDNGGWMYDVVLSWSEWYNLDWTVLLY